MPVYSFRRYGTLYVLAWLPLLALYTFVFSVGELSPVHALRFALIYTVPPAIFGVMVIRACIAMPWSSERRGRFIVRHIALAALFAGLSAVTTFGLFSLSSWLLPPVEQMAEEGNNELGILLFQFFLDSLLYCILVGFTYAALGEIRTRQQAAAAARAEALRAQAELRALRAQVNPHFLFNTLHSLLALVRKDPQAAEEALEQFGDLMRYALRCSRTVATRSLLPRNGRSRVTTWRSRNSASAIACVSTSISTTTRSPV